jgi:hypothetical protein
VIGWLSLAAKFCPLPRRRRERRALTRMIGTGGYGSLAARHRCVRAIMAASSRCRMRCWRVGHAPRADPSRPRPVRGRDVLSAPGRAGARQAPLRSPSRKFNDDCAALKHVHIWAFRRIRGNCRRHSAITHIGRPGVTYDPDSDDAGGDWCERLLAPPASFLTTGNLSSLAIDKPAPALGDGDHCREMAAKLRQLARYTKSPGIRREAARCPRAIRRAAPSAL